MKAFFCFFLCFVFLGGCATPALMEAEPTADPTPKPEPAYTVLVDFGHGGSDGGASGTDTGIMEAELNLSIGYKVARLLEAANIRVILTRKDENSLADTKREDMKRRSELMADAELDAVLSIHMNKFSDRVVQGPMTYYQADAKNSLSKLLAQDIIDALTNVLQRKERLANPGNYMVTRVPQAPAVLIECGFLSNAEDERNLQNDAYQDTIAAAIAEGLFTFLQRGTDGTIEND